MLIRLFDRFRGYERLRHRGDCLFLAGEFERAGRQYQRARRVLRADDHRSAAIEALLRDCASQQGQLAVSTQHVELFETEGSSAAEDDDGGFYPGIEELFELAIDDKEPRRRSAYRALGENFKAGYVALVQGNAERAVRLLTASDSERSPSFVVQLELGRAWSLAEKMDEAREALMRAERSAPHDVEVGTLLSAVNIELGRFDEARERLESLESADSEIVDITFLLGRALAGGNHREAALDKFRETVKLEPRYDEAYFEAASVLRAGGDFEGAFELLSRACSLVPDEIRYNRELAETVLAGDQDAEAGLAACDRLMVTDEDNAWQYLHWIGELYIRRGWIREARDPLQKSLQLVPADHVTERFEIERRLRSLDG